jgi:hypothetical protein
MAKKMAYTDKTGTPHPESYWRIVRIIVDVLNGEGFFQFAGYHDKAARDGGKPPFEVREPYEVRGSEFLAYYAKQISGEMNLMQIGYDVAMKRKELTGRMIAPSTPENPTPNEEDNPVPEYASFFAEASDAL